MAQFDNLTRQLDDLSANVSSNLQHMPIKVFKGEIDENWVEWLEKWSLMARAKNYTPAQKCLILPTFLDGLALAKFRNFSTAVKSDFQQLSQSLTDTLVPSGLAEWYSTALQTRKQRSGESLSSFYTDIESLLRGAYPNVKSGI